MLPALAGLGGFVSAAGPVASDTLTLQDALWADPRAAGAACSNVDYDPVIPGEAHASLLSPPAGERPTAVDIFLFVQAVDRIDPATNSFRFQGYGGMIWCDPRLTFDPVEAGVDRRAFPARSLLEQKGDIWWPGLVLPEQLGQPEITNDRIVIHYDGTVEFQARVNTRLTARYDFRSFPRDRQTLRISLEPYPWRGGAGGLAFRKLVTRTGVDRGFQIPEWEFEELRIGVDRIGIGLDERTHSHFWMEIDIERRSGYYFWKIILPLLIIVGVAWSTFWLTRDVLAQRQRQVATAVLTLVAFQFSAVADLPRVSYLTLMDRVMMLSYLVIGLTFVTNVLSSRRYRQHPDLGLAFDRKGRWIFPAVYFAGLLAIFVTGRS
jgi:hypothetical protein